MKLHEAPEMYEKVISENEKGTEQVKLTINTFYDTEYLHLRKYYMDFEEEWQPTPKGVALPLDFNNSRELFRALTEIISLAESRQIIEENFGELIKEIYPEDAPNKS